MSDRTLIVIRVAFTAWMLFWIPMVLWVYGPQNFLWLCNLAKFVILCALWTNNSLLVSSQAGTVSLVGAGWLLDLIPALITGGETAVFTGYMFNPEIPLIARVVSLYHVALPVLVIWLCVRIGYDSRGPWLQSLIGALAIIATWLLTEPYRNINLIWQPPGPEVAWLPTPAIVVAAVILYPLLLYFPGHWLVRWIVNRLRS